MAKMSNSTQNTICIGFEAREIIVNLKDDGKNMSIRLNMSYLMYMWKFF
jgi:hypothetical protein